MNRAERSSLAVSRRGFLRRAAGAGTVLGTGLLGPGSLALRAGDDQGDRTEGGRPNAIPVGVAPFAPFAIFVHHRPPTPGGPLTDINEQSNITDFSGVVGRTLIRGGGIGTNTETGDTQALAFQADMGFNQGTFIGTDGRRHQGTFGFV
jgi:hypothetical protein